MPLVSCKGCSATFDVTLDVLGKRVKCPKCKTSFVANTKRTGPRRKQASQAPYWIGGTILAVLALILVVKATGGGDQTPPASDPNQARAAEAARTSSPTNVAAGATARPDTANPEDPLVRTVNKLLQAIQDQDSLAMIDLLSFPRIHDRGVANGEAETTWTKLSSLDKTLARETITDKFLGDEEGRRFLREARQSSFNLLASDDQGAEVHLNFISLLDERTQQDLTLTLNRVGSLWVIVQIERGAIVDPDRELQEAAAKAPIDRAARIRAHLYAEITAHEHLADTDAALRSRIDNLCGKLRDLSLGREQSKARRELVTIGRAALPALLTLMVDFSDDLTSHQNLQILNLVVQALRDITLENHGFAPTSSTPEDIEANKDALMRWHGWWRNHKDTWTGPRVEEPPEDDDE